MYDAEEETAALGRARPAVPCPRARLRVTVGPDAGLEAVVDAEEMIVGTSPAAGLRVSDPTVSRRHAVLSVVPAGVRVVDTASRNGTFVHGMRVRDLEVPFGTPVVLGSTTLVATPLAAPEAAPEAPPWRDRLGPLRGASPAMLRLYARLEKLAQTDLTVLIEGETGTGKELVAETLHELSPRAQRPFVVFDCTTVPPALMESELLGHEKGAFTGAAQRRQGQLELAHTGTLFIDELAELESTLQPKLLRAIERREFRRVGGAETQRIDVRIVAATRRDLDAEVAAGRFRDDLFHRLAVARVVVPPLRERPGDATLLARHFAAGFGARAELPAHVLARFESAPWPGNVRELRNAVARYVALGEAELDAAPSSAAEKLEPIAAQVAAGVPYALARDRVLAAFDRTYVEAMLARHGGNVSQAARAAGIGRRYFHTIKARVDQDD